MKDGACVDERPAQQTVNNKQVDPKSPIHKSALHHRMVLLTILKKLKQKEKEMRLLML